MSGSEGAPRAGAVKVADGTRNLNLVRWECRCQQPPILLATYDSDGRVNIKVRDRYWHVYGVVRTVCPRCGSEHVLDLRDGGRRTEDGGESPPDNVVRFPTPDA